MFFLQHSPCPLPYDQYLFIPFFKLILLVLLLCRCVESIVYYGVSFASVLLGGNIYLSFFIINSAEIPATIITIWTIERYSFIKEILILTFWWKLLLIVGLRVRFLYRFGRKRTTLVGMVLACVASVIGVVFRMHQDYVYDGKFGIDSFSIAKAKYF